MGDHFIAGADGAYRVVSQAGDTLVLHTRLPLQTPWAFLTGTSLTAMIQSRSAVTNFGVPDSVLDIAVSDGNHFLLSQHFGLQSGPNFAAYFSVAGVRQCQLIGQPLPPPTVNAYLTWQPGDAYIFVYDRAKSWGKFNHYTIRSRWTNAAQDTVWFEVDRQLTVTMAPDTIVHPTQVATILYSNQMIAVARLATGEVDTNYDYAPSYLNLAVSNGWEYAADFGGAMEITFDRYPLTPDNNIIDSCGWWTAIAPPCDFSFPGRMIEGFGNAWEGYAIGATITTCLTDVAEILCYKRGTDSLVCPSWYLGLTGQAEPAALLQFRVASSASGQPRLTWEGLTPGKYRVTLTDLQGRVMEERVQQWGRAGSAEIGLPGAAGLYLLRIESLASGGARTLRLPQFGH